ncbi:uncharacterized protein LOC127724124 isoform X2 [Mytilus californianus]|uniref:uncharacterized protein LOC127724124 isoform X2 n=1 Tax=Mytilus californianus TaxID=6549 RepID=UPI0022459E43|nr:uncharacterized protein LOC127724124 isoform X2 [Mytilus californianus]
MLRPRQSSYVINNVNAGQIDLGNTAGYEKCIDYIEKDDYDQIPADRDTINHDYLVLTSTFKKEFTQSNNEVHQKKHPDSEVHQKKQSVLRPIFLIMLCIIITASISAVVTFFVTKQIVSEKNEKYKSDATQCNITCCNNTEDASCPDVNQTCKSDATTLIPHPNTCQLYYNCSQAVSPLPTENRLYDHIPQILRPAYLHECPYPQLFSANISCQNYTDVKCGSRYETKNKCDYLAVSYYCLGACKACIYFTPDCVGFADGIHRNTYISPPGENYFECQDERNIYGGQNPCPTNMAPYNGKCRDLFEIPASYWQVGYAIDCSGRPNGNYESEREDKCDKYYTCVNGNTTLTYCDSAKVFDSKSSFCRNTTNVCTPCGSVVHGC